MSKNATFFLSFVFIGLVIFRPMVAEDSPNSVKKGEDRMFLTLVSPSFEHQCDIPSRFTCEGADISPALQWSGIPQGTQTLALIVDDPDAPDPKNPRMTWVHWILYNIPASATELPEGLKPAHLPSGTQEGLNDWKRTGYGGPCPPIGKHRYFFKLYALDTELPVVKNITKSQLEKSMQGHILATAELIGLYKKAK